MFRYPYQQSRRDLMKKFVILAKYTNQGTDGQLKNPDEDRKGMVMGLAAKLGGELIDIVQTHGDYDVIAIIKAPDADTVLALKLPMMKTGAISKLNIHEGINLAEVARKGGSIIGLYKDSRK